MNIFDLKNVHINNIDMSDYPDFCDAYVAYAEYKDGTEVPEDLLDDLQDQVNEYIFENQLYIQDIEYDYDR